LFALSACASTLDSSPSDESDSDAKHRHRRDAFTTWIRDAGGGTPDASNPPDSGSTPDLANPPASGGGPTAPCNSSTFHLKEGLIAPSMPAFADPPKGALVSEPTFNTCLTRVTDHASEPPVNFARNDYSRRQAFNADSSFVLIYDGSGSWHLYDANTWKWVRELTPLAGDAEPQWHPTDPNTLYYLPINGGTKILAVDVRTNATRTLVDFAGRLPWAGAAHIWTKSEGSPSEDARFWGFQVEDSGFGLLGFIVWDMMNDKIVGTMASNKRPDHCSMSATGRWFVISWDDGTWAYSPDFATKKQLHARSEHSDLAIGADGHDYYVSIDYQSNEGWMFMTDMDTGVRQNLLPTYLAGSYTAVHFSGKAFDRPGWVLVSTYGDGGPAQWLHDKVFVMEMKASPRVYELAFHRSEVGSQYFAEPHASVNRDFTRIMFNSNWGNSGSSDIDAYSIRLPPTAFP
jgi:hypothetical protein